MRVLKQVAPARPGDVRIEELAREFDLPRRRLLSTLRRNGIPIHRRFEKVLVHADDARLVRRELRAWLRRADSVRCRLCGGRFRSLTPTHLAARHWMTGPEYKALQGTFFLQSFDLTERMGLRSVGRSRPGSFRWTPDRLVRLRRGFGRIATAEVARSLGTTPSVVARKARLLRLVAPGVPRWTEQQDALLRRLVGQVPEDEIARRVGRSPASVRIRVRDVLGLHHHEVRGWTKQEDAALRRGYRRAATRDLAAGLGRTVDSVARRARALCLTMPSNARRWTAREQQALARSAAKGHTAAQIARRLGRTQDAVVDRAARLRVALRRPDGWTRLEEDRLRALAARVGLAEAARRLGRSHRAGRYRARKLGLLPRRRRFSAAEIRILRAAWGRQPVEGIARRLARPPSSVATKARELGMGARAPANRGPSRPYTAADVRLLRTLWGRQPAMQVAERLNRTCASVANMASALGLSAVVR